MDEQDIDLVEALGASQAASPQILSLYIPSVDKSGESTFDQNIWIQKAGELLSVLGGGGDRQPSSSRWMEESFW
jgi:hypothetical protein